MTRPYANEVRPQLVALAISTGLRRYDGQHPTEAAHEIADKTIDVLVALGVVRSALPRGTR